ncbi:MAG: sugar transferase [Patescibacteria group bacterium]|jgi:exopolysaccharide biosynthesis polyprenyl glycosylphosphotransferase
MKRSELFFTAALVPLDFLMLLLAAVSAYFLRFTSYFVDLREVKFDMPFAKFIVFVSIIALAWLIIFAFLGLYDVKKKRRFVDDLYLVFVAVSTGMAAIFAYLFFSQELFGSRFIVLFVWLFSIVYVVIARQFVKIFQKWLYRFNIGVHRVVLVGLNSISQSIVKYLTEKKYSGYKVVARIKSFDETVEGTLERISQRKGIDEIIQIDPKLPKGQVLSLIDFADERKIDFKYAPDLFGTQATNIDVETFYGVPIVYLRRTPLDGWGRIIKRIIDFILALILLIILSPIFFLVALIIKIDSRGPVFVRLKRVKKDGEFYIFKFRSMVKNAHKMKKELLKYSDRKGPLFKMKDDPRVTRVGRILRKTRIDELPQLMNVVCNEMSLIGPRPHEPQEVEKYTKHQRRVLEIKPGMTGMAQVSGASDLSFNEEVRLDTYYIEDWSLLLDLQIFLKTIIIVITMHGAA